MIYQKKQFLDKNCNYIEKRNEEKIRHSFELSKNIFANLINITIFVENLN